MELLPRLLRLGQITRRLTRFSVFLLPRHLQLPLLRLPLERLQLPRKAPRSEMQGKTPFDLQLFRAHTQEFRPRCLAATSAVSRRHGPHPGMGASRTTR